MTSVRLLSMTSETVASGTCGADLIWVLSSDGTLTISGVGEMSDEMPWYDYAERIASVVIEDGVTSIYDYAFCEVFTNLTSVFIPASVTSIGYRAFVACPKLRKILVDEANPTYCNDSDGVLYSKDQMVLIQAPATLSGQYTVLDTVVEIGDGAFGSCVDLTSMVIPQSVCFINDWAFAYCTGLTSVTFEGDAPIFNGDIFYNDTLTAYYPEGNETWTSDVMQDYGGTVTWVAYDSDIPGEPTEPDYTPGDITGDGRVNNRDAARLMQYLAGWDVEYVEAALDVNGDGRVNNRDAARLLQYLAGWDVTIQ